MDVVEPESLRVLVADDDPVVRLLAREVLELEGFQVLEAADGVEAWERIRGGTADIVLLDVLMPGADGFEVLRRIREEGLRVPVLVITALEDVGSIEKAYRLGATDFTTKPLNWTILAHRVRYVLRASRDAEELRRHRAQLAEAQRIAGIGSWAWHPASGRMVWSEQMHRLLGRPGPGPEDPGALLAAVPEKERGRVDAFLRAAAEGRLPDPLEHRLLGEDGVERVVRHRAGPLEVSTGWVSGTVQDVTREVDLERRLRQAEKLEALGTLAGGIAHDFNNLLVPIVGLTELVLAEIPPGSSLRGQLETVASSARRARDLVRQILAFSRGSGERPRPVCLGDLAREVMAILAPSVPEGARTRVEAEPGADRVMGDPVRLHQVLLNLCRNGLQALEGRGGDLIVRIRRVELGPGEAERHPGLRPGRYVSLEVRDTGCGMEPEVMARVFEPFFTTRRIGQGTGLGLSLVHGVVRSHEGAVEVESQPGAGTCFRVLLPATDAVEEARAEARARAPAPAPARASILLVDDEETLLRFARQVLEANGHRVETFREGGEALARFMDAPDRFGMIIADHSMPGISGTDLIRAARRIRPDIPAVLCTGWVLGDEVERLGVRRVLVKPLTPQELVEAVDEVLREAPPGKG